MIRTAAPSGMASQVAESASARPAAASTIATPQRFGEHHNAFGFLRLLFASLVIVAHTPELMDGDRSRELLTQAFHGLTFGDLAVDGFFVISGYLIAGSYLTSRSALSYLKKRVARIYPAYALASIICVFLVGRLAGGHIARGAVHQLASALVNIVRLTPPVLPDAFAGTHYPALNGAAWTIRYEFGCYLLILLLGVTRLLGSWRVIGMGAALFLLIDVLNVSGLLPQLSSHVGLSALLLSMVHLAGLFLAGSVWYLLRDRIVFSIRNACLAAVGLLVSLALPPISNAGFAVFGGYLIFLAAAWGSGSVLARINNRNDISHGLYLYAWPIEKLLLLWHVSSSLLVVGAATWLLAAACGAASWFALEKPVMALARPRRSLGRLTSVSPH